MHNADGMRAGDRLVLVTGAAGKIGSYVVRRLIERGFRVRAITSRPRVGANAAPGVEWRVRDFIASIDFDRDVEGCAAVVHLAAEIARSDRMQRVNVEATRALARASERAGLTVFCYTSSASVYGNSLSRTVTEESPTLTADRDIKAEYSAPNFLRAYGRTKLLGEIALREDARSVDYVIVRPTVVVDVDDVLRLRSLGRLRKSLTAKRHAHFIYIADVADAIVWLVEKRLIQSGSMAGLSTYNLAEDEYAECSYEAILRKLRTGTGHRAFSVVPAPRIIDTAMTCARFRNFPIRFGFGHMFFSTSKLMDEGFRRRFGLEHLYREAIGQI